MGSQVFTSFDSAPDIRLTVSAPGIWQAIGDRSPRPPADMFGGRATPFSELWASTPYAGPGRDAPDTLSRPRGGVVVVRPTPPAPTPYAPAGERALYDLLQAGGYTAADLEALGREHPAYHLPITTLSATLRFAAGDLDDTTCAQLETVFHHSADPATHPFFATCLQPGSHVVVPVAPGVEIELPFSRDAVGLMLAELYKERERLDLAIAVVEEITPTAQAAVSLAELYCAADRNGDVINLTNGVGNDDDATALLLTYRGIALARTGLFRASMEAFNQALRNRSRAREIRHLALRHRAELYAVGGRNARARRDLERILTEDADAAHVRRRLASLSGARATH